MFIQVSTVLRSQKNRSIRNDTTQEKKILPSEIPLLSMFVAEIDLDWDENLNFYRS